ncbi:MAG: sulfite oxidase [Candidatus Dormibacteraeota bacterium]|nr:sulfite oxidase [Candidatus Dormibacteraeota bacterium]
MQLPGADLVDNLVVRRADPLNCETLIADLVGGVLMPSDHFYIRNHFSAPRLDPATWRLRVGGLVKRSLVLNLRDLLNLPARTMVATLECAGNGRSSLNPPVAGEQWGLGAVGTAEWRGVPLAEVLRRAGVDGGAQEVVFRGADGVAGERFERSLTLKDARNDAVLLAYAMNGAPLPVHHGYPLRVIVPGWYGVASVKWLTEIELIGHAFSGHFQTEKYVYAWQRDGDVVIEPVRRMRVRALITHPTSDEIVELGTLAIRGLAWSGLAPIARVEVCVNDGAWQQARMLGRRSRYRWQGWELMTRVERPGRLVVRARATDQAGWTQPEFPEWNRLGYGNNAVQQVAVRAGR